MKRRKGHQVEYQGKKYHSLSELSKDLELLLEPGGIDHSESSRNNQSELIRNSQCPCLAN